LPGIVPSAVNALVLFLLLLLLLLEKLLLLYEQFSGSLHALDSYICGVFFSIFYVLAVIPRDKNVSAIIGRGKEH